MPLKQISNSVINNNNIEKSERRKNKWVTMQSLKRDWSEEEEDEESET